MFIFGIGKSRSRFQFPSLFHSQLLGFEFSLRVPHGMIRFGRYDNWARGGSQINGQLHFEFRVPIAYSVYVCIFFRGEEKGNGNGNGMKRRIGE